MQIRIQGGQGLIVEVARINTSIYTWRTRQKPILVICRIAQHGRRDVGQPDVVGAVQDCCSSLHQGSGAEKKIVDQFDQGGRIGKLQKTAIKAVVHNRVVRQDDLLFRVVLIFKAKGNDAAVLRRWALLDEVSNEYGQAAVWHIYFVASIARFARKAVVIQVVEPRPAFHQMPRMRVVGIAIIHGQAPHRADVNIVRKTIAIAVAGELARLEKEVAHAIIRGQNTHFIVVEIAVPQGQAFAFLADPRAIVVGYLATRKLYAFHRTIRAFYDPNCLAFGIISRSFQMSVSATYTFDYQVVGKPFGHIPGVKSGVYFHRIAVGDKAGHSGWDKVGACWSDLPNFGLDRTELKKGKN